MFFCTFGSGKIDLNRKRFLVNVKNILSSRNGVQTFRTLGLINVFYKLGFIVNYGTGSVRIREAYAGKVLQPEIKVIDRYFL